MGNVFSFLWRSKRREAIATPEPAFPVESEYVSENAPLVSPSTPSGQIMRDENRLPSIVESISTTEQTMSWSAQKLLAAENANSAASSHVTRSSNGGPYCGTGFEYYRQSRTACFDSSDDEDGSEIVRPKPTPDPPFRSRFRRSSWHSAPFVSAHSFAHTGPHYQSGYAGIAFQPFRDPYTESSDEETVSPCGSLDSDTHHLPKNVPFDSQSSVPRNASLDDELGTLMGNLKISEARHRQQEQDILPATTQIQDSSLAITNSDDTLTTDKETSNGETHHTMKHTEPLPGSESRKRKGKLQETGSHRHRPAKRARTSIKKPSTVQEPGAQDSGEDANKHLVTPTLRTKTPCRRSQRLHEKRAIPAYKGRIEENVPSRQGSAPIDKDDQETAKEPAINDDHPVLDKAEKQADPCRRSQRLYAKRAISASEGHPQSNMTASRTEEYQDSSSQGQFTLADNDDQKTAKQHNKAVTSKKQVAPRRRSQRLYKKRAIPEGHLQSDTTPSHKLRAQAAPRRNLKRKLAAQENGNKKTVKRARVSAT